MPTLQALEGASSKLYYVMETTRGVTPTSPVLKELRSTSGMPTLNMDLIEGAELGAGREVSDVDLGNVNISASITCELSYGSQDDMIAGALSSSWVAGSTVAGLNITVDETLKTYTRDTGDFLADGILVGDFVQFPSLVEGTNSIPRFVTAVTALVITVGGVKEFKPLVAETATTDLIKGDSTSVGSECNHMTVIAEFEGKCGGASAYLISTGVEIASSNISADQNAKVSAEFSMIGYDQHMDTSLPAGSTVEPINENTAYSNTNSTISFDNVVVGAITTFGYSTEDNAAANFTLGSDLAAFVTRGRIKNTVTASAFLEDFALVDSYRNKQLLRMEMILYRSGIGATAFVTNETLLTEVTPERSEGPVNASLTAQAIGDKNNSSIIVYRIPEA